MADFAKLNRLQEIMRRDGIDLVVVWPSSNWAYLLGFAPLALERPTYLMITQSDTAAVVPEFDRDETIHETGLDKVHGWIDADGPGYAIAKAWDELAAGSAKRVALDDTMPFGYIKAMERELAGREWLSAGGPMMEMRLIKDTDEIAGIRNTSDLLGRVLARCGEVFRPGITEKQAELKLKSIFLEEGADTLDFVMVQVAPHSASPHHMPGNEVIQPGQPVLMDLALSQGGYYSDISRNLCLGEPPAEYLEAFEIVRHAQAEAVKAVKPGEQLALIDDTARGLISKAGYGPNFTTRTGHGLGLDVHEPPSVWSGSELVMQPGMVFTVEPGIYLDGRFGIRVEDTVTVTETGVYSLTSFPRDLIIL